MVVAARFCGKLHMLFWLVIFFFFHSLVVLLFLEGLGSFTWVYSSFCIPPTPAPNLFFLPNSIFFLFRVPPSHHPHTGQDCQVCLWSSSASSASTACVRKLHHHSDTVLSASWLPDNQTLVTAGQDRLVAVVGIDGEVLQSWRAHRVQDVIVHGAGKYILVSSMILCDEENKNYNAWP